MFSRLSTTLISIACISVALTAALPNYPTYYIYARDACSSPTSTGFSSTGTDFSALASSSQFGEGDPSLNGPDATRGAQLRGAYGSFSGDPSSGANGFNGYTGQFNGVYNNPSTTGSDSGAGSGTSSSGTGLGTGTGSTGTGTTGTGTTGTGTTGTGTTGTGSTGTGSTGTGTTGTGTTGTGTGSGTGTGTSTAQCGSGTTAQCCSTVDTLANSLIAGLLTTTGINGVAGIEYGGGCQPLVGTCGQQSVCCTDTSNALISVGCTPISAGA